MGSAELARLPDRQPLENIEAEAALLGAVLIKNSLIGEHAPNLRPEHFYEPLHGRIYERILALLAGGSAVTAVTLKPYFDGDEALRDLGGIGYLLRLTGDAQGLLAPRELAEQIRELAERRQTRDLAAELVALCGRLDAPAADVAAKVQALVAGAGAGTLSRTLPFEWAGDVKPVLEGNWLIDGFLPRSGPAVLFGHPGSGKTFLALSIAAAVADGVPWDDRRVNGGPVLYVAAEGVTGFRNRLAAIVADGKLSRNAKFVFVPTLIDLLAPDGDTNRLIATLEHFAAKAGASPALVVIDTLSKTFGGGKENSDDMAVYVANCSRIAAAFDCLTLIVHHRPKDERQSERGHSSLRGGVETSILVEGGEVKTATTVKQKDGPDGERVAFTLDQVVLGQDSDGRDVTTCIVRFVGNDGAESAAHSGRFGAVLSGHAKTARRVVEELLALHGEAPPADIPDGAIDRRQIHRVVGAGQVADMLAGQFEGLVSASPDKRADTAKRTARRALATLKGKELLGSWGDWVWLR